MSYASYYPIANTVPQYSTLNNTLASAYYLKGYVSGTTTPLAMATTTAGGTTLAKCKLNAKGYPISDVNDETSVFIPQFNADYKLALYTNSTDADNNTLASAVWVIDAQSLDLSNVSYTPELSGAVSRTIQTWLREKNYPLSDYGGGTSKTAAQNAAALTALSTAIAATAKPGTIEIPRGNWSIGSGSTGVTIDVSFCSLIGDLPRLDFSAMTSGTAITLAATRGYADASPPTIGSGGPYYNVNKGFKGLEIFGPGPGSTVTCIYYTDGSQPDPSHNSMEHCGIFRFLNGIKIGANSSLLNFDHVNVFQCGNSLSLVSGVNNIGERIHLKTCLFANGVNGLVMEAAACSVIMDGCSVDGMSGVYFYVPAGHLCINGGHVEGNFDPDYPGARVFWDDNSQPGVYTYTVINGMRFVIKSTRTNPVFDLDGANQFTQIGGYVYTTGAAAGAIYSGSGSGQVNIFGTFVDAGTSTLDTLGASFTKNLQWGNGSLNNEMRNIIFNAPSGTTTGTIGTNVLNAYEDRDGAFTPGVAFGGGTTGVTYTAQRAGYDRVGKKISFELYIALSSKGSSTGALTITGLPYTAKNESGNQPAVSIMCDGLNAGVVGSLQGHVQSNSTTIMIYEFAAGAVTQLVDTKIANTSTFRISGSYEI